MSFHKELCLRVTTFHRCGILFYFPISSLPESFSCIYSTPSPFTCGYLRLVMCVNLCSLTKFLKSTQLYCGPLSDIEFSGTLCWLNALFRAAITVLPEATSYFNVVWKTIHVRQLLCVVFFQKAMVSLVLNWATRDLCVLPYTVSLCYRFPQAYVCAQS